MGLRLSLTDRLAPLSEGRIQNGNLACNYHGWEFDRKGACLANPQVGPLLPCCRLHWLCMLDMRLDYPIACTMIDEVLQSASWDSGESRDGKRHDQNVCN